MRKALQDGDWQTVAQLIPASTLAWFQIDEAAPVLARIRSAGNVIHY